MDGESWYPVEVVSGAGNSTEQLYYNVQDYETTTELTYYRIMQVDYDGAYDYSKIVVYIPGEVTYNQGLYPNPNIGEFYIDLGEEELKSISITNIQGKSIGFYTKQMDNIINVQLESNIPNGFYSVITITNKGVTQRNFVKK